MFKNIVYGIAVLFVVLIMPSVVPANEAGNITDTGKGYGYVNKNYDDFLPEFRQMPIFQDLTDDDILGLLAVMRPRIIFLNGENDITAWDINNFMIIIKTEMDREFQPRRFKYDVPKYNETGMLEWVIPSLSQFQAALGIEFTPPYNNHWGDTYALEVSGAMLTRFYNKDIAPAQGVMLRNLLGMLAQKVSNVRAELYQARTGWEMYTTNPEPETPVKKADLNLPYITEGPMAEYRTYLPQLKTTTLFQDIADDDIIKLLETMRPAIIYLQADETLAGWDLNYYVISLKTEPERELQPRRFKWSMPADYEPGMIMCEIPSLSQYPRVLGNNFKPFRRPRSVDLYMLEVPNEMFTTFYNEEIARAQSVLLRNYLGILAQKVMDVRQDLFYVNEGIDLYATQN